MSYFALDWGSAVAEVCSWSAVRNCIESEGVNCAEWFTASSLPVTTQAHISEFKKKCGGCFKNRKCLFCPKTIPRRNVFQYS